MFSENSLKLCWLRWIDARNAHLQVRKLRLLASIRLAIISLNEFLNNWSGTLKSCFLAVFMTLICATVLAKEQLADPTQPPGMGSSAANSKVVNNAPSWVLHSTLIAGDRRVATINGKSVSVGAQVDGATVLEIEPGYVRVRIGKQERQLELLPKEIKYVAQGDAHGR